MRPASSFLFIQLSNARAFVLGVFVFRAQAALPEEGSCREWKNALYSRL